MDRRSRILVSGRGAWVAVVVTVTLVATGVLAGDPPRKGQGAAASQGAVATEPIVARVNNEVITYKALAEECISRKGPEILETMISKLLVQQACRRQGIKVTPAEVDEEVGRTAARLQMTREQFMKVLKEERGIDPERYNHDIVWPGIALKKLATSYVKVTPEDIERGFDAQYGEKVKCRWIMFDDARNAMKVWNELRDGSKTKDGKVELAEFERQVSLWSADPATRPIGGQMQPIAHNASPMFQNVERAAFALKENGEISPVVQLGNSYVILYREGYLPPQDVKLETKRAEIEAMIYDAKLREQMGQVFLQLQKEATIENLITGDISVPNKDGDQAKTERPGEPPKAGTATDSSKASKAAGEPPKAGKAASEPPKVGSSKTSPTIRR